MRHIVSSEQMKALDNRTINELGIPSRVLMETAGKGCADYLHLHHSDQMYDGIAVLCGYGNNGGDGYVIARWLHQYGYKVRILEAARGNMSPETAANRLACEKLEIPIIKYWELDEAKLDLTNTIIMLQSMIIDAIYGIGFRGKLSDLMQELFDTIDACPGFKVAIDIPSGLNADNGCGKQGPTFDLTLAIDALKTGHLLGDQRHCCGKVEIIPIGIPEDYYIDLNAPYELEADLAFLPQRKKESHKGDHGRVAVFAGSQGMTGAAFLASRACLKAGAGLVTIFVHPQQMLHFAAKPWEVMLTEIPVLADGSLDDMALNRKLEKFDLILYGPGIGVTEFNTAVLTHILQTWLQKIVIDADGLNILAANRQLLPLLSKSMHVLTPHWGEFCRLAEITMEELKSDPVGVAKRFTEQYPVTLLLKSYTTIYIKGKDIVFNTTGNDGLATGGSGDVLAGLIAGFMSPRSIFTAFPLIASYYLGKTAEYLATRQETFSITPTDILEHIFMLPEIKLPSSRKLHIAE